MSRLGLLSALDLSLRLERSARDERVQIVIFRGAEMASERRPEWWRWTCWMAGALTLHRCGITPERWGCALLTGGG